MVQMVSSKVILKSAQEAGSSHTAHLIPLTQCRLAVVGELPEGSELNPEDFKCIGSGDSIYIRAIYKEGKTDAITASLVITHNTCATPHYNAYDPAMVQRV